MADVAHKETRKKARRNRKSTYSWQNSSPTLKILIKQHTIQDCLQYILLPPKSQSSKVSSGSFLTDLERPRQVRFTLDSGRTADIAGGQVRAMSRSKNI
jgi:hypothetical protein